MFACSYDHFFTSRDEETQDSKNQAVGPSLITGAFPHTLPWWSLSAGTQQKQVPPQTFPNHTIMPKNGAWNCDTGNNPPEIIPSTVRFVTFVTNKFGSRLSATP